METDSKCTQLQKGTLSSIRIYPQSIGTVETLSWKQKCGPCLQGARHQVDGLRQGSFVSRKRGPLGSLMQSQGFMISKGKQAAGS